MARKPFGDPTLGNAGSARPYEENTGSRQDWKPQKGQRTHEAGGWGGRGYRYEEGENGVLYAEPGTRISDEDVARYRELGAQHRPAVQLDLEKANRSQPMQMGSLARLSSAARGDAPSRAAALGQIGTSDAIRSARRIGRGPGSSVQAMRGSLAGLSNQAGTTAAQVGDMRAQEMSRNRGDYFGGASGMRKQDIGTAVTDAQLDAANRDLEQRRRLQFEQMAWDTKNAEMFGMVEQRAMEDEAWNREQALKHQESENERQQVKDVVGAGTSMFTGMITSDRAGKNTITYGSLAGMGRRR